MNNSGSDFSGVKVGDRLWLRVDKYEGPVEVEAFEVKTVRVYLLEESAIKTFYWIPSNGRIVQNGPQVLFYDKVEIIPPPRPKRMVKKTIEVRPYQSVLGRIYLDDNYGLSRVAERDYCGPEQTIEIEVEE